MGVEIERKFKVKNSFRPTGVGTPMAQGYLSRDPKRTVRIRMAGIQGFLTIKGETHGASRCEYEYEIPPDEAQELLALCDAPPLEKTRYVENVAGFRWEVDVFHGANEGLVVAEIELTDEAQEFPLPAWAGAEVTGVRRYYNAALIAHPYRAWSAEERAY
ncbi:CYTH domain-containing protein [Selenomonas dianae]|uniref:CYTH domain-containing protein n=1 Tax=Selenomonas dianae TaxID=135079 RepID=A0ABN0T786_9FIRM|nr:CYTH domain-containing protein [Selenomonas dianae]WLD82441.1 CYTH domain-containing protein [Selenomonas dianae]